MEGLSRTVKNLIQDSQFLGQYFNLVPSEYETGVLMTWLLCSGVQNNILGLCIIIS
jgi:hypothetical protein